jgi:acyl transferase domain-containing protein/acyl-CoA synthetase (AMP-forming)/AMP-acid ligase II/predicted O-methyltransferase YrrM
VPPSYTETNRALEQLIYVWNLLEQPPLLTHTSLPTLPTALQTARIYTIAALQNNPPHVEHHQPDPHDTAFYSLTSGSTGTPKCIILTHHNVISRARGANQLCQHSAQDIAFNWLPFDHIGSISDWHIRCLDVACQIIYAPKEFILSKPLRWLDTISTYRITHSWAPNFAYALINEKLNAIPPATWDLSCLQSLLTAGESITPHTIQTFINQLQPYQIKPHVIHTAFGMAEMASGVTYFRATAAHPLPVYNIDRQSLTGTLRRVEPNHPHSITFVSLGPVIPGISIRIVNEQGDILPQATIGHVQIQGAPVSRGYYPHHEISKHEWFDTGDLGFLANDELVITGRAKDTIIINGTNYYSQEIEAIVEQNQEVENSYTAACAVSEPITKQEQLAIFFHTPITNAESLRALIKKLHTQLTQQLGIKPNYLIPLAKTAIPKTTLGKIQRQQLSQRFQAGEFDQNVQDLDILLANENTLPLVFTHLVWQPQSIEPIPTYPGDARWLIFSDRHDLGETISSQLPCYRVESGTAFIQITPHHYRIMPTCAAHYDQLLQALATQNLLPLHGILYFWIYSPNSEENWTPNSHAEQLSWLWQALKNQNVKVNEFRVIASHSTDLEHFAPNPHFLAHLNNVPNSGYISFSLPASAIHAAQLLHELRSPQRESVVVYQGEQRLVPRHHLVPHSSNVNETFAALHGKNLVIYGGWPIANTLFFQYLMHHEVRLLIFVEKHQRGLLPSWVLTNPLNKVQSLSTDVPSRLIQVIDSMTEMEERWQSPVHHILYFVSTHDDFQTEFTTFLTNAITELQQLHEWATLRDTSLFVIGNQPFKPPAVYASVYQSLCATLRCGYLHWPLNFNDSERWFLISWLAVWLRWQRGEGAPTYVNPPLYRVIKPTTACQQLTVYFTIEATALTTHTLTAYQVLVEQSESYQVVDDFQTPTFCHWVLWREPYRIAATALELWPSVAEYFVYDDLIYHALTHDERRNRSYQVAMRAMVKGKIVVDVGTGKEAIQARMCLDAGAEKVYAIEIGDVAFQQAQTCLTQLGLTERIILIHGDATQVQLPELVDVCVSELVGPIGGCEGAAYLMNDARRFLKPGGTMLPAHSITKLAALQFPTSFDEDLGFNTVPGSYCEKIFAEIGYPFDLRVCLKNVPADHLLSTTDVLEELNFNQPLALEETHSIQLQITKTGVMNGFLVWLNLHTMSGEIIDILQHQYSWLPVYFPVFHPGISVHPGDVIIAQAGRTLSDDGIHPDYHIVGKILRTGQNAIEFAHYSYHHGRHWQQTPFYQQLFAYHTYGYNRRTRLATLTHHLPEMRLTASGTIDYTQLQALTHAETHAKTPLPLQNQVEQQIAQVWQEVLGIATVGTDDNFFELGGHSLLLIEAQAKLQALFGAQITLVALFNHPTIAALARYIQNASTTSAATQQGQARAQLRQTHQRTDNKGDIAVIGMACRFPGANTPAEFWHNLQQGIESITEFNEAEVLANGIDATSATDPHYVKASPLISHVEDFDADFFGYSAKEAMWMDPQHRLFLEVTWEALEDAGYNPLTYDGAIGLYAGASMNTYLLNHVYPQRHKLDAHDSLQVTTLDSLGGFQLMVANDKDYLTTRVSYKLNLRGPSIAVQTACSTTLVTMHLACQSLLAGECDIALSGGSTVQIPQRAGHLFQEGMITSPDGHCRAFDAQAQGTVFGSGVGVVVLKRLEQAQTDGDHIYAVIKGSAVNNDGLMKVGYMAPSSEGQTAVTAEALAMANVAADSIQFIECHGTGTAMGDPIEINGLSQAFRTQTDKKQFCAVGSVKTNVGHLQIASGIAGFMKTVLALYHQQIPPTLHYHEPNPQIDFANSPFYVNTKLMPWSETPRRAGVNSLGIGGTNAHVILEEAPLNTSPTSANSSLQLFTFSAKTPAALQELITRYQHYLVTHTQISLADLAFTLNTGRVHHEHRLAILADSYKELMQTLSEASIAHSTPILLNTHAPHTTSPQTTDDRTQHLINLATHYIHGTTPNWQNLYKNHKHHRLPLPTYPFQRQHHWLDNTPPLASSTHWLTPLLEKRIESPLLTATVFQSTFNTNTLPFLVDHQIGGQIIVSGACYIAMLINAVYTTDFTDFTHFTNQTNRHGSLTDILFAQPLSITTTATVQLLLTPTTTAAYHFKIVSRTPQQWITHTSGNLLTTPTAFSKTTNHLIQTLKNIFLNKTALSQKYHRSPGTTFYATQRQRHIHLGTSYQWIQTLWHNNNLTIAHLQPPLPQTALNGYQLHPGLIDASFGLLLTAATTTDTFMPFHIDRVQFHHLPLYGDMWGICQIHTASHEELIGDVVIVDQQGNVILTLTGLKGRKANSTHGLEHSCYQPLWLQQEFTALTTTTPLTLLPAAAYEVPTTALAFYSQFIQNLESHCVYLILHALEKMHWQPRESFTLTELCTRLHVIKAHDMFMQRLLMILKEAGYLAHRANDSWQVLAIPPLPCEPLARLVTWQTEFAAAKAELTLLHRCMAALPQILQGELDPLQVLMPHGDLHLLEDFYQTSVVAQWLNQTVARAVSLAISQWPANRSLRLLEIGAGTGSTTQHLLPLLPVTQTVYVFSDISPHFLNVARERFSEYAFVHYKTLDIERSPALQGFTEPFDIIIAANVLHATADLKQSLSHVISLLAPNGLLFLIEGTAPVRWIDLTYGLLQGWWRFTDYDLRPHYPLVTAKQWHTLLEENGLKSVQAITPPDCDIRQAVIMAQRPAFTATNGSWLIFADELGKTLATHLQARGASCVVVYSGTAWQQHDATTFTININDINDYRHILTQSPTWQGIIHTWSLTSHLLPLTQAQQLCCASTLYLIQALVHKQPSKLPKLFFLTRGAVAVTPHPDSLQPVQALLWGMGKAITLEYPEMPYVRLDVENETAVETILGEIDYQMTQATNEDQVAYRQRSRYVARLARYQFAETTKFKCRSDSSYLITGGLGGLGLRLAQWLVNEQGVKHLILIGRHKPSVAVQQQLQALNAAQITVMQADVAQYEAIAQVLAEVKSTHPPLRGIIHAAGVLQDGMIANQTWEQFAKVLAPKVQGAWNLHVLTANMPLDFFILFSSVASLLGNVGQANHAAANSFLDALAHYRQAQGLVGLSLNWSAWAEIGAAANYQASERLMKDGINFIKPHQGIALCASLFTQSVPQIGIMPIDWMQLATSKWGNSAFISQLKPDVVEKPTVEKSVEKPTVAIVQRLTTLSAKEQRRQLTEYVQAQIANVLGKPASAIDANQGLFTTGIDSLTAVDLRNRLQKNLNCSLPATVLFNYPSVTELVNYLLTDILQLAEKSEPVVSNEFSYLDNLSAEELERLIKENI